MAMLGMPELLNDPRFAPPLGQLSPEGKEEFEATIWIPWLMERTKQQALVEIQAHDIYSGAILTFDEVVDRNPQLAARGYFVEIDHPVAGRFKYPGTPVYSPKGWWRIRRPPPLLGQHTEEVLQEAQAGRQASKASPVARPPDRRLPLEGIRVIDITVAWAGPYGTMFLGDMGAEVIRVESLNHFPTSTRGQLARPDREMEARRPTSTYPNKDPGQRPWNRHAGFNIHSRNKSSMTADLTTPAGREVFRKLVEVSDVFVENNGVGSMERLNLTYDVLSQWNPRLIMVSSTGLGQTGPWARYRGMGNVFEALYGHPSIIGYPDMDIEGAPASVASDAAGGAAIVFATVMALHQREKTDKGCFIDLSQGENLLLHFGEYVMDYTINERAVGRLGNRDQWLVQGAYPCAGDDEWIAISLGTIEQWHALCRLMGRPELMEDERFADMQGLHANHDEADQIIRTWTADKDNVDLFHRLQQAGVVAGPLLNEPLAYADPHLKERGFFVPVTQADASSGPHHQDSGEAKIRESTAGVSRKPSSDCKACGCSSKHLCGLTAWNT